MFFSDRVHLSRKVQGSESAERSREALKRVWLRGGNKLSISA